MLRNQKPQEDYGSAWPFAKRCLLRRAEASPAEDDRMTFLGSVILQPESFRSAGLMALSGPSHRRARDRKVDARFARPQLSLEGTGKSVGWMLTATKLIDLRLAAGRSAAETLQTPRVSRRNRVESHLRLARVFEGLDPDYPELCFPLPIPDRQAVLNAKRTPNSA
jgi:hypothetical protein